MDRFQELLWDLGDAIDLPLHVDKHRACRLIVDDALSIQMELDSAEEFLIIGALIAEIPPGKYREILLTDALKANEKSALAPLGYIARSNSLTLSDTLSLKNLSGAMLTEYLDAFVQKAKAWKAAIESGSPAPVDYLPSKPRPTDLT